MRNLIKKLFYVLIIIIFILLCFKVNIKIVKGQTDKDPAVWVYMVCPDGGHQFSIEKWQVDTGRMTQFVIPSTCLVTNRTLAVDGYSYTLNNNTLTVSKNKIENKWSWWK